MMLRYVFTDDQLLPPDDVRRSLAESLARQPDLPPDMSADEIARFYYLRSGTPAALGQS